MATSKPVSKTATKKTTKAEEWDGITAYCVKTKEKNVPMLEAVVDLNNGRYIAKGVDADGNKMTAIMSKDNALAQIKAGNAKKGTGWGK